ncbi:atrial natriuretic peptide receptor 1-like protein [Aphelenchoides avenae]|nr:atrial natriuretic peptide receptor 1-like protein [Aphelenchus avenae]
MGLSVHLLILLQLIPTLTRAQGQRLVPHDLFPLHAAVFLPLDQSFAGPRVDGSSERHLATIESVRPVLDVAQSDAYQKYIRPWMPWDANWLQIYFAPILECDNQKRAAWAALEAIGWTNGSGLDVTFGPACDYVLATVARILSYYQVPMFTNAGFSEFFQNKEDSLLTRIGPLHDHITMIIGQLAQRFEWKRPQLLYQKSSFWESELLEAGFCKLLMNGMYVWTVEKKWDLQVEPRIVPVARETVDSRGLYKSFLIEAIGTNHGGKSRPAKGCTSAGIACGITPGRDVLRRTFDSEG